MLATISARGTNPKANEANSASNTSARCLRVNYHKQRNSAECLVTNRVRLKHQHNQPITPLTAAFRQQLISPELSRLCKTAELAID